MTDRRECAQGFCIILVQQWCITHSLGGYASWTQGRVLRLGNVGAGQTGDGPRRRALPCHQSSALVKARPVLLAASSRMLTLLV